MKYRGACLTTAIALLAAANATINSPEISPTPPMGFNNWARFMFDLNETLFVETAEAMKANGFLAAGYNRLTLDDAWMHKNRTIDKKLQWNETLFPHGIPWLANHVKSLGFSLGIYGDSGIKTCGGSVGSLNHEELDAELYASWGIDFLKLDGCNMTPKPDQTDEAFYKEIYGRWHRVIANLSKPMIFSESAPAYFSGGQDFPIKPGNLSNWYRVMEWAPLYGELARHSDDIFVYAKEPYGGQWRPEQYWNSIMANYATNVQLARYQQPGFYNDPDFLIVDYPWLTLDEKKSHFALWASFSAPLIISSYIPALSRETDYLKNEHIIAVNQDPLGFQATLVSQDGTWDVLTKSLSNGDRLVTVLNRGNTSACTSVNIERLGLAGNRTYEARDLWTNKPMSLSGSFDITLDKHATAIYRISGVDRDSVIPTGMIFNTLSKEFEKLDWNEKMAKYFRYSTTCLTANVNVVTLEKCSSKDSQVWRVASNGAISPISTSSCITSIPDMMTLRLEACTSNNKYQEWAYLISGTIINMGTGLCITGGDQNVIAGTCIEYLESQTFSLPSGVRPVRANN
jgi:alpha-galactosidase